MQAYILIAPSLSFWTSIGDWHGNQCRIMWLADARHLESMCFSLPMRARTHTHTLLSETTLYSRAQGSLRMHGMETVRSSTHLLCCINYCELSKVITVYYDSTYSLLRIQPCVNSNSYIQTINSLSFQLWQVFWGE